MTVLIPKLGPDSSPEDETLSEPERAAVNRTCKRVLDDWELSGCSWEPVDLVRALNAGAAMVVTMLRKPDDQS